MPLTKCKECGHAVSTSATNCPECGGIIITPATKMAVGLAIFVWGAASIFIIILAYGCYKIMT